MLTLLDAARPFAEQAEKDAQAVVTQLSRAGDLESRERAIELIAQVTDAARQRVLTARAAKTLGERRDTIERAIRARQGTCRQAQEKAREGVRRARLLRLSVSPGTLIVDLEEFYSWRRYLPESAALVEALFCMNTYTFDLFDTTPYLAYESAVPGCGKTASLERHEAVCARPYLGADPSAAALFRRIDRDRPTWLLDEAAIVQGDWERGRELTAILDVGYKRGATVSRCEGANHILRDFQVYSPKVLAKIGSLKATHLDRSVVVHLEKAALRAVRRKVLARRAVPLKERLEAYSLQYGSQLEALYEAEPDVGYWPALTGREDELWGPLLMHAKLAGSELESRALKVALEFSKHKAQIALSEDHNLALAQELWEVLKVWQSSKFSPHDLLQRLLREEAWGEALEERRSYQGKVCVIGRFLTQFRLQSRRRERTGTTYDRVEAMEVIARHIPQIDVAVATNATRSQAASPPDAAATPGDTVAKRDDMSRGRSQDRNATGESGINTDRVFVGSSDQTQGSSISSDVQKMVTEAEIQEVDLDELEDVL